MFNRTCALPYHTLQSGIKKCNDNLQNGADPGMICFGRVSWKPLHSLYTTSNAV